MGNSPITFLQSLGQFQGLDDFRFAVDLQCFSNRNNSCMQIAILEEDVSQDTVRNTSVSLHQQRHAIRAEIGAAGCCKNPLTMGVLWLHRGLEERLGKRDQVVPCQHVPKVLLNNLTDIFY